MIKNKIRKKLSKELIWVKEVINLFPKKVADYRAEKNKNEILYFFKSYVYILSKGKASLKAIEIYLLIELNHKGIKNYSSTKVKVPRWNGKEITI